MIELKAHYTGITRYQRPPFRHASNQPKNIHSTNEKGKLLIQYKKEGDKKKIKAIAREREKVK